MSGVSGSDVVGLLVAAVKPSEVAIYCRCSVKEMQVNSNNIGEQVNSIHHWLDSRGLPHPPKSNEFADIGWTGGSFEMNDKRRPAIITLENQIEAGNIKVVLVYRLDRFIRGGGEQIFALEWFHKIGVRLIATSGNVDWSDPEKRLVADILGAVTANELREIRRRVTTRIRSLRRQGWFQGGRSPMGYEIVRDGKHSTLEPLPEDHPKRLALQAMFQLYADGNSLGEVAAILKSEFNYPTSRQALSRKMRSRVWLGQFAKRHCEKCGKPDAVGYKRTHLKFCPVCGEETEIQEGKWRAILDEDLWNRCQDRFEFNRKNERGKRQNSYLLGGMLKEASEGFSFHGRTVKRPRSDGSFHRVLYYTLGGKRFSGKISDYPEITTNNIRCEFVDGLVRDELKRLVGNRSLLLQAVQQYNQGYTDTAEAAANRRALLNKLESTEREEERTQSLLRRAIADDKQRMIDHFFERLSELSNQIEDLQGQVATIDAGQTQLKKGVGSLSTIQEQMKMLLDAFDYGIEHDKKLLRETLLLAIQRIDYHCKSEAIAITWNPAIFQEPKKTPSPSDSGAGSKGSGSAVGEPSSGSGGTAPSEQKEGQQSDSKRSNLEQPQGHKESVVTIPEGMVAILSHLKGKGAVAQFAQFGKRSSGRKSHNN